MVLVVQGWSPGSSRPDCSPASRRRCSTAGQKMVRCSLNEETQLNKHGLVSKQLISCLAASLVFVSPPSQAIPAETFARPGLCQIATVAAIDSASVPLKFDNPSDDGSTGMMMMRGMTAKNFDPVRYSGRWFEVASLKRGFAGQGQEDCHCTQIYSRTPNPGPEFIEKYKSYVANFGYDPSKIRDTPQDCEYISSDQIALMMSMPGMNEALTNQFPDLKLKAPVALNPFTSVFDTLKKLLELYFK